MTSTRLSLSCECGLPLYVILTEPRGTAVLSLRRVEVSIREGRLLARGRCRGCGRYHEIEPDSVLGAVMELDERR